jgi:4-hydroxy-tetrahydrodipicolinate synthase
MTAGDVAAARQLGGRLSRLSAALFAEPNPTVVKAVLHARGRIPTASVRLPLVAARTPATALTMIDEFGSASIGVA